MSRIRPEKSGPESPGVSVTADALLRQEPDEEDEEEDEGNDKEGGDDEEDDDGYSE